MSLDLSRMAKFRMKSVEMMQCVVAAKLLLWSQNISYYKTIFITFNIFFYSKISWYIYYEVFINKYNSEKFKTWILITLKKRGRDRSKELLFFIPLKLWIQIHPHCITCFWHWQKRIVIYSNIIHKKKRLEFELMNWCNVKVHVDFHVNFCEI